MLTTKMSQQNPNLILILVFLIALVLFAGLSASLDSVWIRGIDEQLLLLLSGRQAGLSTRFFTAITLLGSDYVLGVVVLLVGVVLFRSRQTPELICLLAL